jgi:hypothetical protein
MKTVSTLYSSAAATGFALILCVGLTASSYAQVAHPAVSIGANDLGGTVTSGHGPEAGVWVIAETADLPTKFAKIVVTDDSGRYVMPELPRANYSVWVRGYGLVDSPKVQTAPGKILNLNAVVAPSAAAAAEYYPAIYWYSMMKIPAKSEFPGTGPKGNGMPETLKSQAEWLNIVKTNGCAGCHALGTRGTHHPERTGPVQDCERGLGAADHLGPGDDADGQRHRQARPATRARPVRRLDRSRRRGRTACRQTAAATGRGAQPRAQHLGLEPPHCLHAR